MLSELESASSHLGRADERDEQDVVLGHAACEEYVDGLHCRVARG